MTTFAISERRHIRDVLIAAMRLKTAFDETTDPAARHAIAAQLRDTLATAGMKTREDILAAIRPDGAA